MARISENPNVLAFLDMIAMAEIGRELLAASDDGYNVLVGSTPASPKLFDDYNDHPRKYIEYAPGKLSSAAGRYQILARYFDAYRLTLNLPDFSPESQDRIAVQFIQECHARASLVAGNFDVALQRCKSRWASFPGNEDNQHQRSHDYMQLAFENAGGEVLT